MSNVHHYCHYFIEQPLLLPELMLRVKILICKVCRVAEFLSSEIYWQTQDKLICWRIT